MNDLKRLVSRIPIVGVVVRTMRTIYRKAKFPGSQVYWEQNYARGGTSGDGSYGQHAEFKAEVLNRFVRANDIQSVMEFGCGDGNQLSLATYPLYVGLDISKTAVQMCIDRFRDNPSRSFFFYDPERFVDNARLFHADLIISLEVIFHLIEDEGFERYMCCLFAAADRNVIIFSSDTDATPVLEAPHYKNRKFSTWIEANEPEWTLIEKIANRYPFDPKTRTGSTSDFYIYGKC